MVLGKTTSSTLPPVYLAGVNPIRRPRKADQPSRHSGRSTGAQGAIQMLRGFGSTHLAARTMLAEPGPSDLHRVTVTVSAGGEGVLGGLATATDRDHEHIDAYTDETSVWGESIQCAAGRTTARSRSPQWGRRV
jgi:hypothetical protein